MHHKSLLDDPCLCVDNTDITVRLEVAFFTCAKLTLEVVRGTGCCAETWVDARRRSRGPQLWESTRVHALSNAPVALTWPECLHQEVRCWRCVCSSSVLESPGSGPLAFAPPPTHTADSLAEGKGAAWLDTTAALLNSADCCLVGSATPGPSHLFWEGRKSKRRELALPGSVESWPGSTTGLPLLRPDLSPFFSIPLWPSSPSGPSSPVPRGGTWFPFRRMPSASALDQQKQ